MTTDELIQEVEAAPVPIGETGLSKAQRQAVVKAVLEHIEASDAVKAAEERKKKAAAALEKALDEAGEKRILVPDVAKITMVETAGRETLDRGALVVGLMERGVEKKVIDGALKSAVKIGKPGRYCKITPVKGDE